MRTTVVRAAEGFLDLQAHWDPLVEASENGCVFARHDWIRIWLEVFLAPGTPLAIICVWRGDVLIGAAPFWIQSRSVLGANVRMLRFLGTGEAEADEVLPEYLDIVCRDSDRRDVIPAVRSAFREALEWDAASFSYLLPGAAIESLFQDDPSSGWTALQAAGGARHRLQWPAGARPVLPARVAYKQRKLQRAGKVEHRCIEDADGLVASFAVLEDLHARRWRPRGSTGVFASARFSRFHRLLTECWAPQGSIRLHLLSLDGAPVAALYNIHWRGVEYFYQGGLDAGIRGQSPGIAIHAHAIEHAARMGSIGYDFLGGAMHSYMAAFGAPPEPLSSWIATNGTWRGRLARAANRL